MVWYSHILKNFPQFVVIHTVKGFGIVSKADVDVEVDVFLELLCFFSNATNVKGNSLGRKQREGKDLQKMKPQIIKET